MSNSNLILTVILVIIVSFFIAKYIKSCVPVKSNVKVVLNRLNKELESLDDSKKSINDESILEWINQRESEIKSLINKFGINESSN